MANRRSHSPFDHDTVLHNGLPTYVLAVGALVIAVRRLLASAKLMADQLGLRQVLLRKQRQICDTETDIYLAIGSAEATGCMRSTMQNEYEAE